MWNPKINKYVFPAGRVDSAPKNAYDIARLQDILTYFNVAGYAYASVQVFPSGVKDFNPFLFSSNIEDALILPSENPNENYRLFLRYFSKAEGSTSLNFSVRLDYYDINKNYISSSSASSVLNDEANIDFEVIADGFPFPSNGKYVFLSVLNNNDEDLKFSYQYASIEIKLSHEDMEAESLKTTIKPLFILLGGEAGTPAPQPIPQNLTLNSLTLDSSLTMKNGNNTGVMLLNSDGDFQVNSRNINMYNKKIKNVAYPSDAQDVASKNYVDTAITTIPQPDLSSYLKNSGSNTYDGILTISEGLALPLEKTLQLGQNNYIQTISNNDIVIYKGSQFLALNSEETYTNQRLNMNGNTISGVF